MKLKYFQIILIFILLTKPVFASGPVPQILRVSPLIIPITLSPNQNISKDIIIENLSDSPLPVLATVEGFDTTDEEGGYSFDMQENQNPLISWTTITPSDFIIGAKSKRSINLTIKTPKTIPPGGYYALAFFTTLNRADQTQTPVIIPKIGVLMLGNLGIAEDLTADRKAQILTFETDKMFYEKPPAEFTLRVKNSSMNWFSAKPFLTIEPLIKNPLNNVIAGTRFGGDEAIPSGDMELPEKVILPGKIRRWNYTFSNKLSPNIYQAIIKVSPGQGEFITKTIWFAVFPAKSTVIAIVSLTMLGYLFFKRKNIIKSIKIIVNG